MAAKRLRVATEADTLEPVKPLSLSEAIASGTYLQILEAQRRQMVTDLASATGPALAALHRQVALHSKEIAALQVSADQEVAEGVDVPDEDFSAETL